MPPRAIPDVAAAIRVFRERFLGRTDRVAILAPWGKPCPASSERNLDDLLRAHVLGEGAPEVAVSYSNSKSTGILAGRFRIGSYTPAPGGTTPWLCIDFDGKGHADALDDPEACARAALQVFSAKGLPAYLERSGGGHGWHLWCFFGQPVKAAKARTLGRALAAQAFLKVPGAKALGSIEVFPKQTSISRGGLGNMVWLPWFAGSDPPNNEFHRPTESGPLEPHIPEEFRTVDEPTLERVLAELAAESPPVAPRQTPLPAPRGDTWEAAWSEWRTRALQALPLESVYGEWLTGRPSGPGWLQCRDPASPSGDQDPSAGVADGTGDAPRGAFHSFITGETVSVFDFLVRQGKAEDFSKALCLVAGAAGVALPTLPGWEKKGAAQGPPRIRMPGGLPEIRVDIGQIRDIVTQAWCAAHAANDAPSTPERPRPFLFVRSGALVRLLHSEDGPRIDLMDEPAVFGVLMRTATWLKANTKEELVDALPPKDVGRDFLAYPHEGLPRIEAVVSTPVFGAGGALIASPGYHPEDRVWFHVQPGDAPIQVPEVPTDAEVSEARGLLLHDLLVDFPFVNDSDRAHAVAAILLPFVRRMITSCTPIHLLEAPSPGSGKNLLADVISLVTMGRVCQPTTLADDEDETRKKITSVLIQGQPIILIDNVRDGLDSATLSSALTAEVWTDRILGQSRMISLPNRATWLVTANNPRLSLEIARRCVRLRINPMTDRPWIRTGFKHDPLREWVREHRAELIRAALVLVRAWLAAGRPRGSRTLGSFESWATTIGGILGNAQIPGFLENLETLYEEADAEGREWREFVAEWWEVHGDAWVSSAALLNLAVDNNMLGSVLDNYSERSRLTRLGQALMRVRDRQFGQHRVLVGTNRHNKAAQYRLLRVEGAAPQASGKDRGESVDLADLGEGF
jgi:hypothetical protein